MLNVIIFGAPGSGKGTQSELIIKEFGLDHISTGEVLRTEIERQTPLGKIAQRYINKGRLVPDEVAINMLENFLDAHPNSPGIIFDGFPRTIPQAEALKEILNRRGYDIAMVLNLDVAEDELIRRLLERGKKLGRADDNRKTIKARLDIYHSLTAPLTQFYASEGSLRTIRGSGDVESIYQQIKTHLRSCQTS